MRSWLAIALEEILFFFNTLHLRNKFWAGRKKGYLIEQKIDGKNFYHIIANGGGELLVQAEDYRNAIVRRMMQANVPIIPFEAMGDVYAGKVDIEVLLEKYARRKHKH